jgi:hypothetical protein
MKKSSLLLLIGALFLTGCGEPLYEMTESQTQQVADYAASVLTKHNSLAKKGLVSVSQEDIDAASEDGTDETTVPDEQQNTSEEANGNLTASGDSRQTEAASSEGVQGESSEPVASASLSQALGVSGVSFSFEDAQITDDLEEADYFTVEPSTGKHFLVLDYSVANTSGEDVSLDLFSKNATYTLHYDGASVRNKQTLLESDISTFDQTIKASESVKGMLVFEVTASEISQIGEYSVTVSVDGSTWTIQ